MVPVWDVPAPGASPARAALALRDRTMAPTRAARRSTERASKGRTQFWKRLAPVTAVEPAAGPSRSIQVVAAQSVGRTGEPPTRGRPLARRRECPVSPRKAPAPRWRQARRTPGGRDATGRPGCAVPRASASGPVPRWARARCRPACRRRNPRRTAARRRRPPAGSPSPATHSGYALGRPCRRLPAVRRPAARCPAGRSPADRSPAGRSPAVRSPADRSPAVRSPADRSPAGRRPAGRSPADRSPYRHRPRPSDRPLVGRRSPGSHCVTAAVPARPSARRPGGLAGRALGRRTGAARRGRGLGGRSRLADGALGGRTGPAGGAFARSTGRALPRRTPRASGRAGGSGRQLALQRAPFVGVGDARRQHLAATGTAVLGLAGLLGPGPGLGDTGGEDEVLAQRVALEALRQEQVVQRGVVLEGDAEHLVGLALVPGRARVHRDGGGQHRGVVRDGRPQQQPAYRSERHDMRRDAEPGARLVDRAQPVEVGAAEPVTRRLQGDDPGRGRHVDGQEAVRLRCRGVRSEELLGVGGQPADRGHRSSSASEAGAGGRTRPLRSAAVDGRGGVPYRSPSDSRAIFSWSLRIPWSSASGRGGHPGT
ncbi:hypothetical protein SVIOM342S_03196 [Streptomyces violaceorubidus]